MRRVLPPPKPSLIAETVLEGDVWTGHPPVAPSPTLIAALKRRRDDVNGGIRREPELPEHEEIVAKAPALDNEFDATPEDADVEDVQVRTLSRRMQGIARAASLDPADDLGL